MIDRTWYATVFIAGRVKVELVEQSFSERERMVEVRLDGKSVGTASLSPWYFPRVSLSGVDLFVWAGMRLYRASTADGLLRRIEVDDEVHAVYPIGAGVSCVIGELSASLWSEAGGLNAIAHHDEVLTDAWWEADELRVRDFQGRVFKVGAQLDPPSVRLELLSKNQLGDA
jgi:hypothetical protein